MAEPVVLRRDEDGIAVLTLNRPDRMNGWTGQMRETYFDHLEDVAADDAVRAVVVTGAGRAFCAGADMENLEQLGDGTAVLLAEPQDRREIFPMSVPKPVIAALNGACAGIGLAHALMCDVRIAAEDAKITTAFARIGLIAEHGMSWLLARHVGLGNALDLLLSARVVQGAEAQRMGLVQQVCPPGTALEAALSYARDLAERVSPAAMATIKAQVHRHAAQALLTALDDSDRLMLDALAGADFPEGVAAFTQKRPPAYPGIGAAPAPLDGAGS